MRKRNVRLEVRFTEAEFAAMAEKSGRCGLSKGAFVRLAVKGAEVKEAPSADVIRLIKEVRRVGYNLEQVLRIANTQGLLDVPELRNVLSKIRSLERLIVETYAMRAD